MQKSKKGAREIALEILHGVETKESYSNLELNFLLEKYNPSRVERGLTTELVYGVLRRRNTLDWLIENFAQRSLNRMTPWIRNILRLSIYQLLFLERIPISAVCNEGVELAKKRGHLGVSKFVNGVLRNIARNLDSLPWPEEEDLVNYISIRYSHPSWMIARWLQRLGKEETIRLCQANNLNPPLTIRVNNLKTSRQELIDLLDKEGVIGEESKLVTEGVRIQGVNSLKRLSAYQNGFFQVQDESSMLVAHLLDPQPGETILDACSAPGGKTTHLAQRMKNKGKIIANDFYEHKIKLVREASQRLGIEIIETRVGDARNLHESFNKQMDRVLVDAPCSGLGVLRRKPDARWKKSPEDVQSLTGIQLDILESAAQCLKPGGILVYSTCSIEPEENTGVIQTFLERNKDFQLGKLTEFLPKELQINQLENPGYLQIYPQDYQTDGFFLSRLERKRN